jgi:hypothetical protein
MGASMIQSITLLAESDWSRIFANPDTLVLVVPVVGIVVFGILAISKMLIRHRERMAMIERGMHPDHRHESREPELGEQKP